MRCITGRGKSWRVISNAVQLPSVLMSQRERQRILMKMLLCRLLGTLPAVAFSIWLRVLGLKSWKFYHWEAAARDS